MYEILLYYLKRSRYIESTELILTKLKRKDHGRIIVYIVAYQTMHV